MYAMRTIIALMMVGLALLSCSSEEAEKKPDRIATAEAQLSAKFSAFTSMVADKSCTSAANCQVIIYAQFCGPAYVYFSNEQTNLSALQGAISEYKSALAEYSKYVQIDYTCQYHPLPTLTCVNNQCVCTGSGCPDF